MASVAPVRVIKSYEFSGEGSVREEHNVPQVTAEGNLFLEKVGIQNNFTAATSNRGKLTAKVCYLNKANAYAEIELAESVVSGARVESKTSFISADHVTFVQSSAYAETNIRLHNCRFHGESINAKTGYVQWQNDNIAYCGNDDYTPVSNIVAAEHVHLTHAKVQYAIKSASGSSTLESVISPHCTADMQDDVTVVSSILKKVISHNGSVNGTNSRIKEIESNNNCTLKEVEDVERAKSLYGTLKVINDKARKISFGYLQAANGMHLQGVQSKAKPKEPYNNDFTHNGETVCINGPLTAENCNLFDVQCAGKLKLSQTKTKNVTFLVGIEGSIELTNSEINGNVIIKKADFAAQNAFILFRKKQAVEAEDLEMPQKSEEEAAAEQLLEEELNREAEKFQEGEQGLIDSQPYKVSKRKFVPLGNLPKDAVRVVLSGNGSINGNVIFEHCRGILIPNGQVKGKVQELPKPESAPKAQASRTQVNAHLNVSYKQT